jgi:hypothetical protein
MCIVFDANYVIDDLLGHLIGLGVIAFLIWTFYRMMDKFLSFLVRKRRKGKESVK